MEEWIVLVGLLPCDNGRSCNLHPFGCGNLLVLNRSYYVVDIHLRIQITMVPNKRACYIMNSSGSEECSVCFVVKTYAAGENTHRLDGHFKNHADLPLGRRELLHEAAFSPQQWLRLCNC